MAELRFCALGDSLVHGIGDETHAGWPGRLAAAETARGHRVTLYNLGIRGDTSDRIARRWRHEVAMRERDSFPFALIVASTYNDLGWGDPSRPGLAPRDSIALMTGLMSQAAARYRVLWLGPLVPVAGNEAQRRHMLALSRAYKDAAASLGVPFLDLDAALTAHRRAWEEAVQAGGDGHHPTGAGYRLIAETIGRWEPWRALL